MATAQGGADSSTGPLRLKWFTQMLALLQPAPGRAHGGRLIDLGSGHGVFALAGADLGWSVTALDARGDRYPDDDRVEWRVGDVRDVDLQGFDAIACLGLLYHMTLDDQLDLFKRCAGTPIVLDTHVGNGRRSPFALSEEVEHGGYAGRVFREPEQLERHSTASWGNQDSFWPATRSLYRMLAENGYDVMTANPWYLPTRTFFLCVPSA